MNTDTKSKIKGSMSRLGFYAVSEKERHSYYGTCYRYDGKHQSFYLDPGERGVYWQLMRICKEIDERPNSDNKGKPYISTICHVVTESDVLRMLEKYDVKNPAR